VDDVDVIGHVMEVGLDVIDEVRDWLNQCIRHICVLMDHWDWHSLWLEAHAFDIRLNEGGSTGLLFGVDSDLDHLVL